MTRGESLRSLWALDVAVAEQVFGWTVHWEHDWPYLNYAGWSEAKRERYGICERAHLNTPGLWQSLPHFTGDPRPAMWMPALLVVQEMAKRGYVYEQQGVHGRHCRCSFMQDGRGGEAENASLTIAICEAALRAIASERRGEEA